MQYDRHITIFSPEGKLYQIEYAFKAIRVPGDTTIGVRGKNTVCLITTKKVPDKLIDPSSVTRMFSITPNIGCCVTGRVPDSRALIYKARQIAAKFKFDNGYEIPVRHLSHELANYNQMFTQHAYKRVPGCSFMFGAIDDEIGSRLYLVDPAGAVYGYKAIASGQKEQEGMSILEKMYREKSEAFELKQKEKDKDSMDIDGKEEKKKEISTDDLLPTKDSTIMFAIKSLQKVLQIDFKANQVEIGVVDKNNKKFRLLTEKEIENYLVMISEEDDI